MVVAVIPDRHSIAADSAKDEPLKERRTFARRALATILSVGVSGLQKALLVSLVFLPGNVAVMRIAVERKPFCGWQLATRLPAVRVLLPSRLPIRERTGVSRIVQNVESHRMIDRPPKQFTLARARSYPPREQNFLRAERANRRET